MEIDKIPFKSKIKKNDIVFLDACFIISIMNIDLNDKKHIECKKALRHLSNIGCKFVTSRIVF